MIGVHAFGSGNAAEEAEHHSTPTICSFEFQPSTPTAHTSKLNDSSGQSSEDEDEVASFLSRSRRYHPSREYNVRSRQSSSRHGHPQSDSEIDLSDAESDVDFPPPFHRPSSRRRQVTFDLQNTGRPGYTSISGGNQSSVGGSQKIITDHGYSFNNKNQTINSYALINVHIHVGETNTLVIFTVGLFGRGDSMTLRCT